jgi:hypothetical protein
MGNIMLVLISYDINAVDEGGQKWLARVSKASLNYG